MISLTSSTTKEDELQPNCSFAFLRSLLPNVTITFHHKFSHFAIIFAFAQCEQALTHLFYEVRMCEMQQHLNLNSRTSVMVHQSLFLKVSHDKLCIRMTCTSSAVTPQAQTDIACKARSVSLPRQRLPGAQAEITNKNFIKRSK